MKVYFGAVPQGHNLEGAFETDAGDFDYLVELSSFEQFELKDTCGRMVPVEFDKLDELIAALIFVKETVQPLYHDYLDLQDEMEYLQIGT